MSQTGASIRTAQSNPSSSDLLRMPAVLRQTGLGRSTIYKLIACEQFHDRSG